MRTDDPLRYAAIEIVPVRTLRTYDGNARTHDEAQVAMLAANIAEFGFTNPLLIDERDVLIAGHGRLLAAQRAGMDKVPCIRIPGLTPARRAALVLADNAIALKSGWDTTVLAEQMQVVEAGIAAGEFEFDITDIGFTELELKEFAEVLAPPPEPEPERQIAMTDEPAVCRAGNEWMLGPHRFVVAGASLNDMRAADALILSWERQNKGEAALAGGGMTFKARAASLGIEFKRVDAKAQKARAKAD
ncbi:ParB/Srx family N-terminal domain-containing protein [Methylobacterium sp. Leaf112]|uniref:ParB/Srx family N-terminal domain-containing protein n=1 Tax=Methylobacterium sp. Leaf112 TaxID=1736258 RepID=UPI0006FFE45C|nr:ParB/Srx family N-terminal domain-containing protein [Methylobacterium sp. Leaf112]KQP62154.1 hypothetical protein ASF52_05710 [Methylobacterium sp. Leaf112]